MLCLAGIEGPSVKLNIELCVEHFGPHLKLFLIFHFVPENESCQVNKVCSARSVSGYYTLDIERVYNIPTQFLQSYNNINVGLQAI